MQIYQIPEIEGHKISVTTTAASLFDLINAQLSSSANFPATLNALDIYIVGGDVRASWGAEAPTTSEGFTLKQNGLYMFRGRSLKDLQLISISGSVDCEVVIGFAEDDESESATFLA